ncbi:hypothetical protein FOL47_000426 [Perkinsus chesapeaki]|uniref:Uncharacterized protein n=1 Tax=Perkinsus chesapeaki TaxID=330153 RepID=A0A7J6MNG7_PERCH|nr:hypothetical protein FOL47_000426 [Perkinsus chesapeaki]
MIHSSRFQSSLDLPRLQPKGWESKMALLQRQLDSLERGMQYLTDRRRFTQEMYSSGWRPASINREVPSSILAQSAYTSDSVSSWSSGASCVSGVTTGVTREDRTAEYKIANVMERPLPKAMGEKAVQAVVVNEGRKAGHAPQGKEENEWQTAAREYRENRASSNGEVTFRPINNGDHKGEQKAVIEEEHRSFADILREKIGGSDEPLANFGKDATLVGGAKQELKPIKAVRVMVEGGRFECTVVGDRGEKENYELMVGMGTSMSTRISSSSLYGHIPNSLLMPSIGQYLFRFCKGLFQLFGILAGIGKCHDTEMYSHKLLKVKF